MSICSVGMCSSCDSELLLAVGCNKSHSTYAPRMHSGIDSLCARIFTLSVVYISCREFVSVRAGRFHNNTVGRRHYTPPRNLVEGCMLQASFLVVEASCVANELAATFYEAPGDEIIRAHARRHMMRLQGTCCSSMNRFRFRSSTMFPWIVIYTTK